MSMLLPSALIYQDATTPLDIALLSGLFIWILELAAALTTSQLTQCNKIVIRRTFEELGIAA